MRAKATPCARFLEGKCTYGDGCWFPHEKKIEKISMVEKQSENISYYEIYMVREVTSHQNTEREDGDDYWTLDSATTTWVTDPEDKEYIVEILPSVSDVKTAACAMQAQDAILNNYPHWPS